MTSAPVHVAIVDDDPPVRLALARLLSAVGFRVSTCNSAEDFLVHRADDVSCVLLDVHLPRLSGLDLAAVLREMNRQLPFVFITADDSVAHSDAMMRSGATCLMKPFEEDLLLSALVRASAQPAV